MAQYKNSGLDGKTLAERKSKRLEEALSAYTPEQTKQTVSKLLEDFVDESGKNYFGAGTRDTTLYFADDEYIREIEKEKTKDTVKDNKEEKKSVVDKLHKLTSILPNTENGEEEKSEKDGFEKKQPDKEMINSNENIGIGTEQADDEIKTIISKEEADENSDEDKDATKISAVISEKETDTEAEKVTNAPEPEPTIVITPVRTEASKEEDTKEMRREFFDNEIEVEAVPRRRRKQADAEVPVEEKKAPEISLDDVDDDYEEDFEEEEKSSKFGNFFKRRKNEDPFDDDFDDDDFDDDDFEYDDDDYEEGAFTFKKVLNAIVIIALICSTAFFAASNYSNIKKLESANTQINELNNGASGSSEEQINELKAKVDELTAENEKLKGGSSVNTNSSELTSAAATGTNSTTINGIAPSEDGNTNSGSGTTYTIKAGDTGSKICKAVYGQYTDELWQKILSANGMTTSSVYHPGDTLQIP